jgi:hypothetical protein
VGGSPDTAFSKTSPPQERTTQPSIQYRRRTFIKRETTYTPCTKLIENQYEAARALADSRFECMPD